MEALKCLTQLLTSDNPAARPEVSSEQLQIKVSALLTEQNASALLLEEELANQRQLNARLLTETVELSRQQELTEQSCLAMSKMQALSEKEITELKETEAAAFAHYKNQREAVLSEKKYTQELRSALQAYEQSMTETHDEHRALQEEVNLYELMLRDATDARCKAETQAAAAVNAAAHREAQVAAVAAEKQNLTLFAQQVQNQHHALRENAENMLRNANSATARAEALAAQLAAEKQRLIEHAQQVQNENQLLRLNYDEGCRKLTTLEQQAEAKNQCVQAIWQEQHVLQNNLRAQEAINQGAMLAARSALVELHEKQQDMRNELRSAKLNLSSADSQDSAVQVYESDFPRAVKAPPSSASFRLHQFQQA